MQKHKHLQTHMHIHLHTHTRVQTYTHTYTSTHVCSTQLEVDAPKAVISECLSVLVSGYSLPSHINSKLKNILAYTLRSDAGNGRHFTPTYELFNTIKKTRKISSDTSVIHACADPIKKMYI